MGHYHKIAQACRMVALGMVHEAGRGHLGTSFSSADIMVAIRSLMQPGDLFLSSKGHDACMQYALLAAWGLLDPARLKTYRKPGGLPGHPTIDVPGIVANTGSLGMGLSKACGFVHAHRLQGNSGRVFVLLGDGEMSEGQNYEAMLYAVRHDMGEITAVVDCNGWQQDGPASMDIVRIARMFQAAGWATEIAEGNADELRILLRHSGEMPRCLVVRTKKGQGVKAMEEDPAKWHNRGPTDEEFHAFLEELENG